MRRMQVAAIRQGADISQKLNRRRSVASLTESGSGHVVISPFRLMLQLLNSEFELRSESLVRGLLQLLLDLFDLPFVFAELRLTNRRGTCALVGQINARPLAEVKTGDPILELLDTQLDAET